MSAKNKKHDLNKPVVDDDEYQIQTAQADFEPVEQKNKPVKQDEKNDEIGID